MTPHSTVNRMTAQAATMAVTGMNWHEWRIAMDVNITFLGGAGTVTGSKYLVRHDGHSVLVDCGGTARVKEEYIAKAVQELFPLKPREIIAHLKLLRPIYRDTAHDGHFGRVGANFTWERTDMVKALKKACKV